MPSFASLSYSRLAALAFACAVAAIAALTLARPAHAQCLNCDPGGSGHHTYSSTLTVTKSSGTVTSSPAGINCGTDCDETDQQIVTCTDFDCPDPDSTAWTTYTLSAAGGPAGFAPSWTGCDSTPSNTCVVKNSVDKTVTLGWLDVTDPTVSLTSPAAASKVGTTMSVSASASDNAGVTKVEFYVDGVLKVTDTSAPYGGSIDMSGYTQGSSHTVSARSYDTSGRQSASSSASVTVDRAVSLTVGTPPAFTNAATVPVTFTTDSDVPASNQKCALNAGTLAVCTSPYSPIGAGSADGTYTYSFSVTDDVGNVATATRSFVLDRTTPSSSFTDGPAEGGTVGTSSVTISFTYADTNLDTVRCKVDSGAFGACTNADSHTLSGLTDGTHTLTLRVTDKAGNSREITRTFVVGLPASVSSGGGTPSGGPGASGGTLGAAPTSGNTAHARLSTRFGHKGKRTLVKKLAITDIPAGSAISVKCKGPGCPFKTRSFTAKNATLDLSKLFKGRKLKKGAALEIDVLPPGGTQQVFRLTMRGAKKPSIKTA
jgi:hypothetical protein